MSLWVLIRKDEERMSYAENYFFFNSISKIKVSQLFVLYASRFPSFSAFL